MLTSEQRLHLKALMAEKLPNFDPRWDDKIIEMWIVLFDKIWKETDDVR